MAFRPDIIAGRAVIVVSLQSQIDAELRSLRTQLRRFANGIGDIGGDLFRGGLIGSVGAIFPVKEFVAFQDQLLFVQTKLQATDMEMSALEIVIRQLGKSTSFTSKEVASAAQQLAQAGFSIQEVKDSLQAALDLARGGQIGLETSTAILAEAMRSFQIDTDKAAQVASKFITTARLGTIDIVDLKESLKESSGTFKLLGTNLDESLALIAQLSLSSLKATKAGTSLNTAYINLAKNADKLNKIGIVLTDEDFAKPLQLFTKLNDAVNRLGRQEVVATLSSIFNIRGARAAGAVLIQGLDNLNNSLQEIRKSTDEARESAVKLDSRLGGVARRSLSAFQELLLSLGETTEGPLTRLGVAAQGTFNSFSALAQKSPEVAQTLLLIPPAALSAGAALISLSFAFNKVASLLTPIISLTNLFFTTLAKIAALNLIGISKVTKVFGDAKILKGSLNTEVDFAKPFIVLGEALERAANSSASTRLRKQVIGLTTVVRELREEQNKIVKTPITPKKGSSLIGGPLGAGGLAKQSKFTPKDFGLPILNKDFKFQLPLVDKSFQYQLPIINKNFSVPIATKIARQLEFALQQELDFGNVVGKNAPSIPDFLKFPPSAQRSSIGRILARSVQDEIQQVVQELSRLKLYRNTPLPSLIDEAFTAFDLSDRAKKTFKANILNNFREGLPTATQLELVLQNDLPIIGRNFDLRKNFAPKQLSLFDSLLDIEPAKVQAAQKQAKRLFAPNSIIGKIPNDVARGNFLKPLTVASGSSNTFAARLEASNAQLSNIVRKERPIQDFGKSLIRTLKAIGKNIPGTFRQFFISFKSFLSFLAKDTPLLKGLGGAIKSIFNVNYLAKIITGFTKLGTGLKFVTVNLFKLTKFAFSFNGIATALQFIILFGDKIPIVQAGFSALGKAFGAFFSNVKALGTDLGPTFQLLRQGFGEIFTGQGETGFERIGNALTNAADIISTRLTIAWKSFLAEIEPGVNVIKAVFESTVAVINSLVNTVASIFGTVLKNGAIVIEGDGTLLETIKQAFSIENIRSFFGNIIKYITNIGQSLNTILGSVVEVLNISKQGIIAILQAAGAVGNKTAQKSLEALDQNAPRRKQLEDTKIGIRNNAQLAIQREKDKLKNKSGLPFSFTDSIAAEVNRNIVQITAKSERKIEQIEKEIASLGPAYGTFTFNVQKANRLLKEANDKLIDKLNNAGNIDTNTEAERERLSQLKGQEAATSLKALFSSVPSLVPSIRGTIESLATVPSETAIRINALKKQQLISNPRFEDTEGASQFLPNPLVDKEIERLQNSDYSSKTVLTNPMEAFGAAIGNTAMGISGFVASLLEGSETISVGLQDQIATQQERINNIVSSRVGTFDETRGNLTTIAAESEKRDEERNKLLNTIATNTEDLSDAFTFGG